MLRATIAPEGVIDDSEWTAAWERGSIVGTCICGGPVKVLGDRAPVEVINGLTWYAMQCLRCDRETSQPGGRLTRQEIPKKTRPPRNYRIAREALDDHRAIEMRRFGERED